MPSKPEQTWFHGGIEWCHRSTILFGQLCVVAAIVWFLLPNSAGGLVGGFVGLSLIFRQIDKHIRAVA